MGDELPPLNLEARLLHDVILTRKPWTRPYEGALIKFKSQKEPQSQKKRTNSTQRIIRRIRGHYPIKQGFDVIAPESSPESSAKSWLQKFLRVPFLSVKSSPNIEEYRFWPMFSLSFG